MSDSDAAGDDGSITDEAVLEVFDAIGPPAATTSIIANSLGCATDSARRQLKALAERGLVKRTNTGPVIMWWRPREDVEPPTPVDGPDTDAREETEASPS